MAIVQDPAVPLPDPHGLRWWVFWDNTTGSASNPVNEVVTQIVWDNTNGVPRTVLITMKDLSVITVPLAAGATGSHSQNKPQQTSWLGIQFLLA